MSASDTLFTGSIPALYDRYLVPLIFAPYADDIARRVAAKKPSAVLEIAAGTGAVTRAIAATLHADACYVVTDLNGAMLDHARSMQGDDGRIAWRTADACALPFDDASFDMVVCQFGAMFFSDRVLGYREARRVLRPGGQYVFNVWDRIENNEFADTVTAALGELFPEKPPRFLARTPHGYFDVDAIRRDVDAAGFSNIEIETKREASRAATPREPAVAYCQGTPVRNEIEAFGLDKLAIATDAAAAAMAARYGAGEVSGRIQAHVVTATR